MEHAGKHALVTGGGTGIGRDIAQALAEAGAQVSITGRDAARLGEVAETHPNLHAVPMDVTDEHDTRDGILNAASRRGPIRICIANAGIAEAAPFRDMTRDHWRRTMATNLDGAFVTFQAALATLPEATPARMIGIASIAGVRGLRNATAYTASKHGLIGLIRGLSEEYMGGPVTFNALCPGYVDTPIVDRNAAEIAARQNISEAEARAYLARGNRHRILLETEEITAAALWLCSDAARSVNGQTIQIAGGQVS